MKTILAFSVLATACGVLLAKLPPPDEATKAKAAETSAKAAWQSKVDAYLLCKAQDRVAAQYKSRSAARVQPTAGMVQTAAAPTAGSPAAAPAAAMTTPPAAPAAAATPSPGAAAAPAATASADAAAQAAAPGTPVAAKPLPPCVEPGPFAYNPPEQKPLEAAGAHSPSGTAANPPSVRPPSAEMAPSPARKP
jgi:hypothetical protein